MPKSIEFLAKKLKELRKREGLSQENFSEKSKISLTLIRDIERRKANPTLATIDKIADFFQVPSGELFDATSIVTDAEQLKMVIQNNVEQFSINQLQTVLSLIRHVRK
jgi:transcriptional regulator with XRE-family HTH domain